MSYPLKDLAETARKSFQAVDSCLSGMRSALDGTLAELAKYEAINLGAVKDFLREPWCILPKSREEWWVVIPRWVGTQVGWLERSTETYNVFVVNRYSHWLGGIPPELRERLELPPPVDAKVSDGKLAAGADVAGKLKHHLRGQDAEGRWNVIRGHEFDLIAEIIKMGSLPFTPRQVALVDRIQKPETLGWLSTFKEREHESVAWAEFLKWGAIGVYWPFGCGKGVFGIRAITRVGGEKLVVVPTRMLVDQWRDRLSKWTQESYRTTVVTYQSWERVRNHDYVLAIFDEAHRLPANSFSRMSTVRAKYRIGLSASPYREDGRTSHIFALTGQPIGTDWNHFLQSGLISKPQVEVRIVGGWREKAAVTEAEVHGTKGRVLVFCDSIDQGRTLANRLGCPHVYGQTNGDRLAAINAARVSVVSRVGDEGLSLQDLSKVIEVDFLGSSRRQESQRVGRLFHSGGHGRYITLMTRDEFDRFEGRFLALEEKGIKVEVHE